MKHTTEQKVHKLVESLAPAGKGLRGFQTKLRDEGFYRGFSSFLETPIPPHHPIRNRSLKWKPIPHCELLLARIWSPLAEDEKISGYILNKSLTSKKVDYKKVSLLAQTIFEIVGRHNTLSERMAYTPRVLDVSKTNTPVIFRLGHDSRTKVPFSFKEEERGKSLLLDLSYSSDIRKSLVTFDASPDEPKDLVKTVEEAYDRFIEHHTVEDVDDHLLFPALARYLRRALIKNGNDKLKQARKSTLAEIVKNSDSLNELGQAINFFGDPAAPHRSFTPPLKGPAGLVHHYDLYLDFLSVLQASILFAPWFEHATCILRSVGAQDPKSLCLVCVGRKRISEDDLGEIADVGGSFLDEAVNKQMELKGDQDSKSKTLFNRILGADRIDPIRKDVTSRIILGEEKEEVDKRIRSLQLLMRQITQNEIDAGNSPSLGLGVLLNAIGEVSRLVHEGVPCRFLILFGPGTGWRLFNETISREGENRIPLSALLKSNYSIFQDPQVAAFVDINVYPEGEGISYLGRLIDHPDESWMRKITDTFHDLYILNSQGDGVVRLYGHNQLLAKWFHESGTMEHKPETLDITKVKSPLNKIDQEIAKELIEALLQIEEMPGEGALIVLGDEDVDPHISPMEPPELQMNWSKIDSLEDANPPLLRALMRRDGASIIASNGAMKLRQLIFPVNTENGAAVQLDFKSNKSRNKSLLGKGSRHYTAVCLSEVLKENNLIIALSVDGGIKLWRGKQK